VARFDLKGIPPMSAGLPRIEVKFLIDADGIPVLSWAPGKWFFERGKVVKTLIHQFGANQLLIGDTCLRPTIWGTPELAREATEKGLRTIAGSDPLPFPGEERLMGTYATTLQGSFDPAKPASSLRNILRSPDAVAALTGRRCGVFEVMRRLYSNERSKR